MRIASLPRLALMGVVCVALQAAESDAKFVSVNKADAQRELTGIVQDGTDAAMYIWADKYVYQPGEPLIVRGTIKPNDDFYPYTLFAFRVNNQTGVKTYLPGGGTQAKITFDKSLIEQLNAAGERVMATGKAETITSSVAVFEIKPTGWKDANGIHGYSLATGPAAVQTARLTAREYATKDERDGTRKAGAH